MEPVAAMLAVEAADTAGVVEAMLEAAAMAESVSTVEAPVDSRDRQWAPMPSVVTLAVTP